MDGQTHFTRDPLFPVAAVLKDGRVLLLHHSRPHRLCDSRGDAEKIVGPLLPFASGYQYGDRKYTPKMSFDAQSFAAIEQRSAETYPALAPAPAPVEGNAPAPVAGEIATPDPKPAKRARKKTARKG